MRHKKQIKNERKVERERERKLAMRGKMGGMDVFGCISCLLVSFNKRTKKNVTRFYYLSMTKQPVPGLDSELCFLLE